MKTKSYLIILGFKFTTATANNPFFLLLFITFAPNIDKRHNSDPVIRECENWLLPSSRPTLCWGAHFLLGQFANGCRCASEDANNNSWAVSFKGFYLLSSLSKGLPHWSLGGQGARCLSRLERFSLKDERKWNGFVQEWLHRPGWWLTTKASHREVLGPAKRALKKKGKISARLRNRAGTDFLFASRPPDTHSPCRSRRPNRKNAPRYPRRK